MLPSYKIPWNFRLFVRHAKTGANFTVKVVLPLPSGKISTGAHNKQFAETYSRAHCRQVVPRELNYAVQNDNCGKPAAEIACLSIFLFWPWPWLLLGRSVNLSHAPNQSSCFGFDLGFNEIRSVCELVLCTKCKSSKKNARIDAFVNFYIKIVRHKNQACTSVYVFRSFL